LAPKRENQVANRYGIGSEPEARTEADKLAGGAFPDASFLAGKLESVPPLGSCVHFLNLTNGLEALPVLHDLGLPHSFCRIQSTACEQQKFEQMINEVDAGVLMQLAAGRCVLVWDYGSRNRKRAVPRALWYGLEFVRFSLNKEWLGTQTEAYLRGVKVTDNFEKELRGFSRSTKRRLRYFRRYLDPGMQEVRLYGVYKATEHDDDTQFYREMFHRHCLQASNGSPQANARVGSGGLPATEQLNALGFRLFMGGICHKDLQSLIMDMPAGGGANGS